MSTRWPRAAVAVVAAWACAAAHAQPAVHVVDDTGAVVALAAAPQRIVSLLPSVTETVCALGACARLVGVDTHSNWPAPVRALPHVGGLEDADIEHIARLAPDLVLAASSTRALTRLRALGIAVAAIEPRSHAQARDSFERIALLLALPDARERAAALWQRIDDGIGQAAASVRPQARGAAVYYEVSAVPYAAGEASFIGETLARLGVRNIVPAAMGPFPQLNPEYVVRADPRFVFVSAAQQRTLQARPGWPAVRALREGGVCGFDAAFA
ncbi:MAG: ABC transporter substrate-binding protein [Burkholderiaceae bacterium]|nr:ABC transporter substrate-binding protein [Burkholderiaceae bacterium]